MIRRSCRRPLSAALATAIAVLPPLAASEAATTTTNMPVSATVIAACTLTAQPLVFGSYQGVQLDGTTTIGVSCTNGTIFNIGFDLGTDSSGTTRRMLGPTPGQHLAYALARDAAYSLPWGGTVGTDTLQATSLGSLLTMQVYGRIAAGQYPSPGAYTDNITVTITY